MDETIELLDRWYEGDREALWALLERELEWMRSKVRAKLPPAMRPQLDSVDLVQEGALKLLQYGPRFRPANRAQFRALLSRMLLNLMLDRQGKLRVRPEDKLGSQGLSGVRDVRRTLTHPDHAAERNELREWIQLALELLEPDDREVIRLHQFEQLPFAEVASRMQLASADAARMRFARAMPKLTSTLVDLRRAARDGDDASAGDDDA